MFCPRKHAFPVFNIPLEFWCARADTLGNKIVERRSRFQAPLLPRRWYPLKLRPKNKSYRHGTFAVDSCE